MLPIYGIKDQLLESYRSGNRRFIIEAPTGSGKSTQLPQIILSEGLIPDNQSIIVLQPRRAAARLLATRVAQERNVTLGDEVGYQVRLEKKSGDATRIEFVTEGLLLRRLLSQPSLPGVGAVMLDEFHERNIYSDLSLTLLKKLQKETRPDLLLLVTSATLDAGPLNAYLNPCASLAADTRNFPVDIQYAGSSELPIWEQAVKQFRSLAKGGLDGHVLIFMPGTFEIRKTIDALTSTPEARGLKVLPLHGSLTAKEQDYALSTSEQHKVVVSTNVAETSVTLDGVTAVIDSGLARVARYDPKRGVDSLLMENISQSSASQRAGRAGRTAPGRCIRLWSGKQQEAKAPQLTPEIKRVDLSSILLTLAAAGHDKFDQIEWFDPPEPLRLKQGIAMLHSLHALEDNRVTEAGKRMATFPAHPRFARLLLEAGKEGCVNAACRVVALSEGRRVLIPLKDKRKLKAREELLETNDTSDFAPLLLAIERASEQGFDYKYCDIYGIHANAARTVYSEARQLEQLCKAQGLKLGDDPSIFSDALARAVTAAFSDHLALRTSSATLHCRLCGGKTAELRRESVVKDSPLFIAVDRDEMELRGQVKILLSLATAVKESWLENLFPDDFKSESTVSYDSKNRCVTSKQSRRFRDLILDEKESGEADPETAARILAEQIRLGNLPLPKWSRDVEQYVARINFVARHCPDYGFQTVDEEGLQILLEQLCEGATRYKEVKGRDPMPFVKQWLSSEQSIALEQLAPADIQLANRKKPTPIRYEDDGKAYMGATVQNLYDTPGTKLKIGGGNIAITLEILAPNQRPVQITEDLDAFWTGAYPQVKKDLKGRYPKHEWR